MITASGKAKRKLKARAERNEASPSDFSFEITKIAVAQVCKSVGFRRTQRYALNILTVVAIKYLETLARSAASFSNAANRTQSNLLDLTNAVHELSAVQGGFIGVSALHADNSSLKSIVLKDLSDFVGSTDEIPFAKPIDKPKAIEREISTEQKPERRPKHTPEWLPGFTDMGNSEKYNKNANYEELWENSCWISVSKADDGSVEERNGSNGGELVMDRARVKFRIGK